MFTKQQLAAWREQGFEFDGFYDTVAVEEKKEDIIDGKNEKELSNSSVNKKEEDDISKKTTINLAITLEPEGKDQFDRTTNNIWAVRHFKTLADIDAVRDLIKLYNLKNICIVHHGNTFSQHDLKKEDKVVLSPNRFEPIKKVISKLPEPTEISNEYIESVIKKSTEMYVNGLPENEIKAFFSLKLLISNIQENGIFFSVACNEANNENLMLELAAFTTRNIKIFTNSNFSIISVGGKPFSYGGIVGYKSILNSFLTDNYWIRDTGWKYYDTKLKKVIITNKDLWLHSNNPKLYDLIKRTKTLTSLQILEEDSAQLIFSKSFQADYIKKYNKVIFEDFKKKVEYNYPRLKI